MRISNPDLRARIVVLRRRNERWPPAQLSQNGTSLDRSASGHPFRITITLKSSTETLAGKKLDPTVRHVVPLAQSRE